MFSFHVKFLQTDGQTDGQTDNGKIICPRSFAMGGGGGIKRLGMVLQLGVRRTFFSNQRQKVKN